MNPNPACSWWHLYAFQFLSLSKNVGNTRAVWPEPVCELVFLKLHCANLEAWSERPLIAVNSQQRGSNFSIFSTPKHSNSFSLCSPWRERGWYCICIFVLYNHQDFIVQYILKKMYTSYLAKSCWWSLCSLWVELEVQGRAIHRYLTPTPPQYSKSPSLSLFPMKREKLILYLHFCSTQSSRFHCTIH